MLPLFEQSQRGSDHASIIITMARQFLDTTQQLRLYTPYIHNITIEYKSNINIMRYSVNTIVNI